MNEIPEERKLQLLRYIEREYFKQPERPCWQAKNPVYKPTRDYVRWWSGKMIDTEEFIIRYSITTAVLNTAVFFLSFMAITFLQLYEGASWSDISPIYWIIFSLLIGMNCITIADRKPKIIMNAEGLWLHDKNVYIYWKYWVASFIKKYNDGENTYDSLVIHHYDPLHNEFTETEYKLNDDLEVSNEELAYYIEQWKR